LCFTRSHRDARFYVLLVAKGHQQIFIPLLSRLWDNFKGPHKVPSFCQWIFRIYRGHSSPYALATIFTDRNKKTPPAQYSTNPLIGKPSIITALMISMVPIEPRLASAVIARNP
jgi:hypothetical protein